MRSTGSSPPRQHVQHRTDRPSLPGPTRARGAVVPALRRPERFREPRQNSCRHSSRNEIYHLGAQSHVRVSFDIPEYTADITGVGTIRILEAVREAGSGRGFYQASSSEMYGQVARGPAARDRPPSIRAVVRGRQGVCLLGHGELPRKLRFVRPVTGFCSTTNRPGAARPSSPARSRAPSPTSRRLTEEALSRQPRRPTRLGLCPGVRRVGCGGCCAGEAGRLRLATNETHTVREFCAVAFQQVGTGLGTVRSSSTAVHPPRGSRSCSSGITPRPNAFSVGSPAPGSPTLVRLMVEADVKALADKRAGKVRGGWRSRGVGCRVSGRPTNRRSMKRLLGCRGLGGIIPMLCQLHP